MQPNRRFAGLERLYGTAGAAQVCAAHVVVVGIGGVGSWAAEALARSGVGRITLVDLDHVSESNINRQVHATAHTIGQAKVLAMQERIALISAECKVDCVDDFVTAENWAGLMPHDASAVLDACDQVSAKVSMAAWALKHRTIPFVSVGAAGGKRLGHKVDIADLSEVTHDPLMAKVRYQLRRVHGALKDGKKMGLSCVFSTESVQLPDASCEVASDSTLNCHGYGSSVTVTATFGMCAAGWLLEKIIQAPVQKY